jgi:hypothetical protein
MPFIYKTTHSTSHASYYRRFALACARNIIADSFKDDITPTETLISQEEQLPYASAPSFNILYLSDIIKQLQNLLDEKEEDEYGILRANKTACKIACGLVGDAAIISAREYNRIIPFGLASTDSEGGIRIEWTTPTSGVRLVVPANDPFDAYVYHEVDNQYATDPATPESLARWLREIT